MAGLPASALTLKIPAADLLALPAGASYHGKNGQAGVDVMSRGDTLVVTSTCDSLQRQVLWYEEELTRIRGDTVSATKTSETEFKRRFNPVKIALIAFIAGVASGIVSKPIRIARKSASSWERSHKRSRLLSLSSMEHKISGEGHNESFKRRTVRSLFEIKLFSISEIYDKYLLFLWLSSAKVRLFW